MDKAASVMQRAIDAWLSEEAIARNMKKNFGIDDIYAFTDEYIKLTNWWVDDESPINWVEEEWENTEWENDISEKSYSSNYNRAKDFIKTYNQLVKDKQELLDNGWSKEKINKINSQLKEMENWNEFKEILQSIKDEWLWDKWYQVKDIVGEWIYNIINKRWSSIDKNYERAFSFFSPSSMYPTQYNYDINSMINDYLWKNPVKWNGDEEQKWISMNEDTLNWAWDKEESKSKTKTNLSKNKSNETKNNNSIKSSPAIIWLLKGKKK